MHMRIHAIIAALKKIMRKLVHAKPRDVRRVQGGSDEPPFKIWQ